MKSSAKKIELASVDDLFSTEEGRQDAKLEKIQEIPLQELIDLQMDAAVPDSTIREKQAELNSLYDSFSSKYGLINDRANRLVELDTLLNIDGKGQAHAEAVVAKSTRTSVLDSLKRPVTPRSIDKKPKQHEEVR